MQVKSAPAKAAMTAATAPMPAEANFRVQSVEWSPNGDTMLLLDRERFCMCFMGEDGQLTGAPSGE